MRANDSEANLRLMPMGDLAEAGDSARGDSALDMPAYPEPSLARGLAEAIEPGLQQVFDAAYVDDAMNGALSRPVETAPDRWKLVDGVIQVDFGGTASQDIDT